MASSDISTFGLVQGQGNFASTTIKYFGIGRPPTMMMTTSNHRGYQNGDWERDRRPSGSRLLEGLMVHRRTDPHHDDPMRNTERVAAIPPPRSQQLPPKETTRPAAGIISPSSPGERCHRPPPQHRRQRRRIIVGGSEFRRATEPHVELPTVVQDGTTSTAARGEDFAGGGEPAERVHRGA